ncbi:MAG: glycosyl transferase family 2 [Bacteroidetes bacterium]|nr:MAG: glycosyl transferase family 2 [Bacteroidota bacterium]
MIALQLIFWICLFLVFHSYFLFPFLLKLLAGNLSIKALSFTVEELPMVSVLIAAHNEERVIGEKIESVLGGSYPHDKLEVLVGSDASTDQTNAILGQLKETKSSIHIFLFAERKGKPGIINQLVKEAKGEILVISDANVILEPDTLVELIRYFKEDRIGLVDSRLINTGIKKDGISKPERFYTGREVSIKHHESVIWEAMMGPFGGCYALRKSLYKPVPDHFLVDDFFINMSVLEQGSTCISNLLATVSEDVSNNPREEFQRKKRISAGNYQNLLRFRSMIFKGGFGVGFCFFSHKALRWIVPFLVIITLIISTVLGLNSDLYLLLALFQLLVLLSPVISYILRKIGIHSIPLRFISHFVLMNMALLAGFFRFSGGIRNNVWQPTNRNQD